MRSPNIKRYLQQKPDDLDAMAGAGLSLVNVGYEKDDKAQLQEGADLLQKYATLAPKDISSSRTPPL
jgi:hypothetical protein